MVPLFFLDIEDLDLFHKIIDNLFLGVSDNLFYKVIDNLFSKVSDNLFFQDIDLEFDFYCNHFYDLFDIDPYHLFYTELDYDYHIDFYSLYHIALDIHHIIDTYYPGCTLVEVLFINVYIAEVDHNYADIVKEEDRTFDISGVDYFDEFDRVVVSNSDEIDTEVVNNFEFALPEESDSDEVVVVDSDHTDCFCNSSAKVASHNYSY